MQSVAQEQQQQQPLFDELRELIERADLQRLRRLVSALETTRRQHSHYAGFTDEQAAHLRSLASRRLRHLRAETPRKPSQPAKPTKPRFEVDPEWLSEQLDFFGSAERLPRRPYCSDDLSAGLRIRSLAHALARRYIQVNPPHLRVWSIFDVDREGGGLAWQDAGLPAPAWASVNKQNGHAHLVWGLSAPVLTDGMGARDAPMRYLCAIESCMRARLQADPGYSGLITKNPCHPLWRVLRGPRLGYELRELAEYLPELDKHRPRRGVKPERVGLGRNVTLFDELRVWSYRSIRRYWGGGLDGWNGWLSACNSRALILNAELFAGRLLHEREVWHIARSVAKWTWRQFKPDKFSAIQAARGRQGGVASGEARLAASEDKRASARLMRAQGMTQQAIADALGVPRRTVSYWLSGG